MGITNRNVDVILPKLKYGYRTKKATWDELKFTINIDGDIDKLSRSRSDQHKYEVFRYHMKQQYVSTMDYILVSKFNFSAIQVPEKNDNDTSKTYKFRAHPPTDNSSSKIILIPNDFPYYVEENIVHYVLWKAKTPITEQEINDARKILETNTGINAIEILHWVNPLNLKSVPEIDHVHFLCRI